jgi:pimeloyl-ACP methyl ester carboxylesterase
MTTTGFLVTFRIEATSSPDHGEATMATSKFFNANGLRLHYLDYGGNGKPALVCVHGLTGNAHNFDQLAPHLLPKFQVMSLDVRGRGDSEWGPPMDYTAPNYVSDLAAMLDRLGVGKVTLIGTSMGGIISMMFAGGYTDRVDKLVLNDIGPEVDPAGIKRIGSYVGEAPSEFADLDELAAYSCEIYPPLRKLAHEAIIEQVKWSVKPAPGGKLGWKMDPAVRRAMRAGGQASRPPDLWVPYARIIAPLLIVRGAESDVLSSATAKRMRQVLKGVQLVEVPGVGHAPSLTEPDALAAIRRFLGIAM